MVDFEHALFMLLLLVGVFSARPPQAMWALALVTGGVFLVLLPPFVRISIPWDLILNLTIPLLFWQNARRWLRARWRVTWQELLLWVLTVAALAAILSVTGYLGWPGALLFSLVTASMLWRTIEGPDESSYISQLGPLTLVLLLTETAPAVETPEYYLGGLFSGAAVGIGVAFLAMRLAARLMPVQRGWVAFIQVYLAYLVGLLIDVSAIAAALVSVAFYSELSLRQPIDRDPVSLPAPLNSWPVFLAVLALFIFLGWQAHQPLSLTLLLEAGLGLLVGVIVSWTSQRLVAPGSTAYIIFWGTGLRVGLFLLAALLLWPRHILSQPVMLAVAAGLAILVSIIASLLLSATFDLGREADKT